MNRDFQAGKRIVVKVGSSSITHETGIIDLAKINALVYDLATLAAEGYEVVLVSSGAVAAGMPALKMIERPQRLEEKQAAAAVGQGLLIHMYEAAFQAYGITVAQVLLTKGDYLHPRRYMYAQRTLHSLLQFGALPIVNENDTIAVDEFKVGDNDNLAAMVASIIGADMLIILSDVDGLYTANPMTDPESALISEITQITPAVLALAQGTGSNRGTGGMLTKLEAADICIHSGVHMLICASDEPHVVTRAVHGENIGTWFKARKVHPQMRKRQLLFGTQMKGTLFVDEGCKEAILQHGSSILPIGIIGVEGTFEEGDGVSIRYQGQEIARGTAALTSEELMQVKGVHSADIEKRLGYTPRFLVAVHRDNLVRKG